MRHCRTLCTQMKTAWWLFQHRADILDWTLIRALVWALDRSLTPKLGRSSRNSQISHLDPLYNTMVWDLKDLQFDKNCDSNCLLENITIPTFGKPSNLADEADSMSSSGKWSLFQMLWNKTKMSMPMPLCPKPNTIISLPSSVCHIFIILWFLQCISANSPICHSGKLDNVEENETGCCH